VRVERIEADYFIETAYNVRNAVEATAGEQSSGTFLPVPGETPELKARSAACVERLKCSARLNSRASRDRALLTRAADA
jgi:ribulose-bisphosphate carboxylase large chain